MDCSGKKHVIKNISKFSVIVDYVRFADGALMQGISIRPNSTVTLRYQNGTLRIANPNYIETLSIEDLPTGCQENIVTTTTTEPISVNYGYTLENVCNGKKHTIKNISNKISTINYVRYSDGFIVENSPVRPGSTITVQYQKGTLSFPDPNDFETISISNLPYNCQEFRTTTTTTTEPPTIGLFSIFAEPEVVITGSCYGSKVSVFNNSSKIGVYSYNRFGDNLTLDNQQINPGETHVLWLIDGSFYTAFVNEIVINVIENLPVGCDGLGPTPTPTQTVTPSITPSITPSPTQTPSTTQTPTTTPSNTPSNTASATPGATPTPTPTNTSSPTATPSTTPTTTPTQTPSGTAGATPTPTPSITASSTETPTPTSTSTPTQTPGATSTPTPSVTSSATPTPSVTSTPPLSVGCNTINTSNLVWLNGGVSSTSPGTPSSDGFTRNALLANDVIRVSITDVSFGYFVSLKPFFDSLINGDVIRIYNYPNPNTGWADFEISGKTYWDILPPFFEFNVGLKTNNSWDENITFNDTQINFFNSGGTQYTSFTYCVPTPTNTPTPSVTPTNSATPTVTPTNTQTPSSTPTNTPTVSITPSITPTNTSTPSQTPEPTSTPTASITPTNTPTQTTTPTNTPTQTTTSTPTQTPTNTPSPTASGVAPSYFGYIFAEPQDPGDDTTLLNYATANGAVIWYSWFSAGVPNNGGGNYSNDLNVYAHQPSFINGTGNFITPVDLSNVIAQTGGQVISGISQNQYTFGSIEVASSDINTGIRYFYTTWLPLDGVGGTFTQMLIDVGTTNGGTEVFNDLPAEPSTNSINVVVTSGAAIPAGTYRVLWSSPQLQLPGTLPLTGSLYFRGDTKS